MQLAWRPDLRPEDLWGTPQKRPTVLFNAISAAQGGSLTVLRNYWRCFGEQRPDWRVIILHGPFDEDLSTGLQPCFRLLHCGERVRGLLGRYLWERRWLGHTCQHVGADVYFGPNGVYHPGVRIPQCLLIQDPAPYVLPPRDWRDALRAFLLRRSWRAAVRHAAGVGYTSQYMRSLVLGSAAGHQEHRHLIAYNGIDQALRERAQQPFRTREQRAPFILSVSTFAVHKDFETLIAALGLLRQRAEFARFTLRIFGRNIHSEAYIQFLRGEIARLGLELAVRLEIDRPWSEITAAYDAALLFSLTSRCESFGIPALEAMAHGTPVVAGNCCAIPEVCGDAALLVPPREPQAVANAWAQVLGDQQAYEKWQGAGRRRCLEFSWDQTVAKWVDVIEELLPRRVAQ
jgi:glycosyltransferase involved in cell wall biosynthesis